MGKQLTTSETPNEKKIPIKTSSRKDVQTTNHLHKDLGASREGEFGYT